LVLSCFTYFFHLLIFAARANSLGRSIGLYVSLATDKTQCDRSKYEEYPITQATDLPFVLPIDSSNDMNFRTKLPRHNLELHSLYIYEKSSFCPVLFFSLICLFFAAQGQRKKSKLKKRIKPDKNMFFRKYTASEALYCAATAFFGNSYISMTKAAICRW